MPDPSTRTETPGADSPFAYTKADFEHKPLLKKPASRVVKKTKVHTTSWIRQLIAGVQAEELEKGRKHSGQFVIRRLIELGARRYAEVGSLPVRDP